MIRLADSGPLARTAIFVATALMALLAFAPAALADHEPDHRYMVSGKVTDKNGKPWTGAEVIVSDAAAGVTQTTKTDGGGNYEVKLHLHDNNLGDEVTVQAGGASATHKVKFNVDDKTSERRGIVDVRTETPAKSNLGPLGGNLPYLIGLAFVLGVAALIFFTYPRKGKTAKAKSGGGASGRATIGPKRKGSSKGKKR